MQRRPWSDFENVRSASPSAIDVTPDMLVEMESYRKAERIGACDGTDPIDITLAYAQDRLIYDKNNKQVLADSTTYSLTPREQRVNVFGLAYLRTAKFLLNKPLADIVIGAAIHLYQAHKWRTMLYDGLRTVDATFKLYNFATNDDLNAGLLALPGKSAHNKGLAVDSMMVDYRGKEVDMGGHFDHLDMSTNMRHYAGDKISDAAKKNRIIREAAFLRSAFSQNLLIAPLRNEFWDDRPPEDTTDLWRVLDSAARVCGLESERNESWNYADFLANWQKTFAGHEEKLMEMIGTITPPCEERFEFYHGNYHPIYDAQLRASGKNLTNGAS